MNQNTYRVHPIIRGDTWSLVDHIDSRVFPLRQIRVVHHNELVKMEMAKEETRNHMWGVPSHNPLEEDRGPWKRSRHWSHVSHNPN